MKIYVREIAWVAIAQGAAFVGGLAMVKASTVVLGPSEYGKLAVALALIGIVQVCLYGAIAQTGARFFALANHRGMYRHFERCLAGAVGAAFVLVSLLCLIVVWIGSDRHLPVPLTLLAGYTALSGTQMVVTSIFNAARKRQIVAVVQILEALLRPIMLLLIVFTAGAGADRALLAYVICASTILAVSFLFYRSTKWAPAGTEIPIPKNEYNFSAADSLTKSMLMFALPFFLFGLLGVIGSHGERLLLANWATWADIGSYALMAQLVMAPNVLFSTIINQFYYPVVFQHDASGNGAISRSFRAYLLVTIVGVIAITVIAGFFGPLLISLFSSNAFLGHEHLLWYLGLSAGLFCIAQQLVLPGLRAGRPAIYMPAKLAHSLTLLGSAFLLVPLWGVEGMGLAATLSSTTYLLAILLANGWLNKNIA